MTIPTFVLLESELIEPILSRPTIFVAPPIDVYWPVNYKTKVPLTPAMNLVQAGPPPLPITGIVYPRPVSVFTDTD